MHRLEGFTFDDRDLTQNLDLRNKHLQILGLEQHKLKLDHRISNEKSNTI